ncbi:PREDICTED: colorectal cancer-associated protein 2 [Sturnus vulgaris]|uniref:colorectal cancer-associated protein 2 n=1 Tax=Sturnus vulgaris TaxID=9172 RepID=UPI00071A0D5E|nr:PREDICTED: colorectal cancer-associated protein 2 [Sturnus vulgaris]
MSDSPSLQSVFPQILAGKPKVYQGVRVKITVKELLQQRRARQAATGSEVSENIVVFALYLLFYFVFIFFSLPSLISGPKSECNRELAGFGDAGSLLPCSSPFITARCPRAVWNRFSLPTSTHTTPVVPTQEKVKSGSEGSDLGDLHKVSWGSSSSIQFAESVSPPHPEPFEAEPIPPVPSCCPSWQFSSCLSCEESPGYLEQLIDSCLQSDAASEPAFNAFQPSSHYTPDPFQPAQLGSSQALVSFGTLGSSHSPACCCSACGSQSMDSRVLQCCPCPSTDCTEFLPPLALADDFFRRDRSCDICYS